ncbi:MAG TPA: PilZ domain-containing protein [Gammaproteobacteria bacterium]|nr:PilZ domain-containing protein [Gammaproteobacteria bacterium]
MNDEQTSDQRRQARVSLPEQPDVLDVHSQELVGRLVNISWEGMMLMGVKQVPAGSLLQVSFPLQVDGKIVRIRAGLEAIWCNCGENGTCWSGFQIIDISPEDQEIIGRLIYD